jgi:hypothetical protein
MTNERVNVPLLRKGVEWVEAEAEKPFIDSQWYQGSWVTNTELRAAQLIYDVPLRDYTNEKIQHVADHCGTAYCLAGYVGQLLDERYVGTAKPEDAIHVADFATDALGLTNEEADRLFFSGNTAADIRTIAEQIAGEKL